MRHSKSTYQNDTIDYPVFPIKEQRKRYPANTKAELLALEEVGITGEDEEEDQTGDMITIYF
jgi:hypothetical protein